MKMQFQEYIEEAKLAGRSPQSIKGSRNRVPFLLNWLDNQNMKFHELTIKEAGRFKEHLADSPRRNRTLASYLQEADRFYGYLLERGDVFLNPFKSVQRPRKEKKLPSDLPKEEEMAGLLDHLADWSQFDSIHEKRKAYKIHVICELLYSTGMRISEVASLKVQDIDFARFVVHVRKGKGGFDRIAFLSSYCSEVLKVYIDELRPYLLHEYQSQGEESLFGINWTSLSTYVNSFLKPEAQKLGIKNFTSHKFRHSVGYHLLRSGLGVRKIQSLLGHKCLKSTEVYTKVDQEELKNILDTFHPRGSK